MLVDEMIRMPHASAQFPEVERAHVAAKSGSLYAATGAKG